MTFYYCGSGKAPDHPFFIYLLFWLHRSSNTLCCSTMSLRMLCCINYFSSCLWVRPPWLPLNLPLMTITAPSLLLRLSIAIWPLLFWNSIVPISIRKPCSVPASPTNSLDLQRTTHHWASQNAGDPSSAHSSSLWTRTLSQEQSGLMDIHSISYFSESFDFFPPVFATAVLAFLLYFLWAIASSKLPRAN